MRRLNNEQFALLLPNIEKWVRLSVDTRPADRALAEAAASSVYAASGLKPPELIWLDSPWQGAQAALALQQQPASGQGRRAELTKTGDADLLRIPTRFWFSARMKITQQVWQPVGMRLWSEIRERMCKKQGEKVSQAEWGSWSKSQAAWDGWHGPHDETLCVHDFLLQTGETELYGEGLEKMLALILLSHSCGWWWAFENVVLLTERPRLLQWDELGRLHSESGPALQYPDGWGFWVWHGMRVPRQVIEAPESLTVRQIEREENVEVRRLMIERFGEERYLVESGARALHRDDWGTLYRKRVHGDEPLVMVKVTNSTRDAVSGEFHDYFLRVPPHMKTAKEAVAWSFGRKADEYQPLLET